MREIDNLEYEGGNKKIQCHQKIPWIRFAGNDIGNYGLILNKADSRIKLKFFIKIIF
jgi:hypothetical protein